MSSGPLFRESHAIAGGPVTSEEREPGECYWQCPNMNPTCRRTGEDAIAVFNRCNRIFAKYFAEDVPECAIAYVDDNNGLASPALSSSEAIRLDDALRAASPEYGDRG